ncbi:hypothetical protein OIU78_011360 [Salix suchowensis]|nr:hypothetical protein OIU78_011360 [Salix suchowensis]
MSAEHCQRIGAEKNLRTSRFYNGFSTLTRQTRHHRSGQPAEWTRRFPAIAMDCEPVPVEALTRRGISGLRSFFSGLLPMDAFFSHFLFNLRYRCAVIVLSPILPLQ